MTDSPDKFAVLDPARMLAESEAALDASIYDKFSVLDTARAQKQLETELGVPVFNRFSVADPALQAGQMATASAVDTTAPDAPVITGFSSDTGASDNATTDTDILISGTAEAGSVVTVYDGVTLLGTATGSSTWSYQTGVQASGAHSYTAVATDDALNASAHSSALAVTIVAPPIARWTFDTADVSGDTITDVSGNGHDGTNGAGGAAIGYGAPGIVGDRFASFTGATRFTVPHHAALTPASMSLSFWVKDLTSATAFLLAKGDPSSGNGYNVQHGFGSLAFHGGTASGDISKLISISAGQRGGPTNVVAVYDAVGTVHWKVYFGASLVGSSTAGSANVPLVSAAGSLSVGTDTGGAMGMTGKLDDLRIYDRALTQAEITAINAGQV